MDPLVRSMYSTHALPEQACDSRWRTAVLKKFKKFLTLFCDLTWARTITVTSGKPNVHLGVQYRWLAKSASTTCARLCQFLSRFRVFVWKLRNGVLFLKVPPAVVDFAAKFGDMESQSPTLGSTREMYLCQKHQGDGGSFKKKCCATLTVVWGRDVWGFSENGDTRRQVNLSGDILKWAEGGGREEERGEASRNVAVVATRDCHRQKFMYLFVQRPFHRMPILLNKSWPRQLRINVQAHCCFTTTPPVTR